MKIHKKPKKLFYVPGIISLLVIPVVFYVYLNTQKVGSNETYVFISLPPKDYFVKYPEGNYKIGYDYRQINLPFQFSQETEEYYFNLILELQKKNIDKTGIKFQLSDENTYEDFIRLMNLMEKSDQPRYGLDVEDDNFYVIHDKKPE